MIELKNYEAIEIYLNVTNSSMSASEALDFVLNLKSRLWVISFYMIAMCVLYAFMVFFGLVGNVWVIKVIKNIFKSVSFYYNHSAVLSYILCLSVVDTFEILLLPFVIADTLLFHWIFGDNFCKIFWSIESATKMMSTFLLTLVSRNRYKTICRSREHSVTITQTVKSSVVEISVAFLLMCLLIWPVPLYAKVVPTEEIWVANNVEFVVNIPKCYLDMDHALTTIFTTYMFALTYFVPFALIIFYYSNIIISVKRHASQNRRSRLPVKRITCSVLLIVAFYFACWTPFWICAMYLAWFPKTVLTAVQAQFFYATHALVYVNSSANWLFYAYLNKNLRDLHRHNSTTRKEITWRNGSAIIRGLPNSTTVPSVKN